MIYTLKDFETIAWNNKFTLPNETIKLIEILSNQVSSPDYSKTPNFSNNDRQIRKKKRHNEEIKPEDWESIRNFQKTEIAKKEGIEKEIDTIRLLINKLTEKTYDVIVEKIYNTLDELVKDNKYDEQSMDKIGYALFNMATSNKFNSNTYAKLCSDLNSKYEFMVPIIEKHISDFMKIFDNMVFVNPDEDYNKFCDMNIENDKRRALSLFITSLEKHNVVTHDFVFENIINIQSKIMANKLDDSKIAETDELIENLFTLITNVRSPTSSNVWTSIVDNINDIKTNKYIGITNKCKFKHMDIIDFINKNK